MEEKYKWYKLDNAAKVFPDTTNRTRSNVFRMAAIMKEKVDTSALQQAVEDLKPRFPMYYVKLKKGLFWYYVEYNENKPKVQPESSFICQAPNFKSKDGYLFRVFSYENRIAVEMFHALTDGNGLIEFIKAIIYRYLEVLGYEMKPEGLVLTSDSVPQEAEEEDSFLKHFTDTDKTRSKKVEAYKLDGIRFRVSEGGGIILGKMPANQVLELARRKGVTVTMYVAALVTFCIYEMQCKKGLSDKPIRMFIPVNMRKFYDSKTLRNFVLYIFTSLRASEKEWTFDEILAVMKGQILEDLKPENLQRTLNANVAIEKNLALNIIPLFIKQFAIRIGFKMLGNNQMTCALSNLGNIELPACMQEHVLSMEWAVGVARSSTHDISLLTNNGIMTINFMRSVYDTELEKLFFRHLAEEGIDVTIESNLWEEKV